MFAKRMEVRSVTERLTEVIHSLKGVLLGVLVQAVIEIYYVTQ